MTDQKSWCFDEDECMYPELPCGECPYYLDYNSPKKRDLTADLALCDAATPGPWIDVEPGPLLTGPDGKTVLIRQNARFIAESRSGWPEAIRRALAAEAEIERMRVALMSVYHAARNDVNRWDGGVCIGTQRFSDRVFARRIVRDMEPLLFGGDADAEG